MSNGNAKATLTGNDIAESFDFDELERTLQDNLESQLSDLKFLKEEKEKIGNPDNLGKVILDEVWKQFGNQIGLDMTNETLIQKYDREHPEQYKDIKDSIMQDQRYKDAKKAMKDQQKQGTLTDEYTGNKLKQNDSSNLDHVVSRKELFENQRRKQGNIATEDLANKNKNLKATNENLNKSMQDKSKSDYLKTQETRKKELIKQNENAKKKIDESNMSEKEKQLAKEKADKSLKNKLDADEKLIKKADADARKAINTDIAVGVAKETAKKAGKDALKTMAISALFTMLKEIMNGLVKFFRSKTKSFVSFVEEMKQAIQSFFTKLSSVVKTGASSFVGTIVTEIFGPIVSAFKKLSSLIKQGISSIIEAIKYLRNKDNKDKPISEKIAQVGKIVTAGIVAGGAIFLGELFEGLLIAGPWAPLMKIQLPLIGTLGNLIGLFLGSLVSGVIGAVIINLIDKMIANRQISENVHNQINKGNDILITQHKMRILGEAKLEHDKTNVALSIRDRHNAAETEMKQSLFNIAENCKKDDSMQETQNDIDRLFDELEVD